MRNLFEDYNSLLKDQKDQAPLPDHYPSELASLSCLIASGIKVKSVPDVFKWQNTFMWLQRNSESDPQIQHYQSFCSPSYAILLPPITNLYTGYTNESGENSTVKVEALLFSLPDMRFITSVFTSVPKPTENKMFTVKYLKIEPQAHRHVATGEIMEYTFDFEPIVLEENK
ncbi:hypothetical protein [Neisseria canis]|uniref:Uncharacterized protein n=1 Tax=Neisseria canis TaxID=493 RepID=A0A448D7E4_9NEIS|nr:hypothetical protein [Neisseria canis]VEF00657.1 Uncharacterised protein [Neisseria canis]